VTVRAPNSVVLLGDPAGEPPESGRPIRDASVNRLTGNLRRLDPPGLVEPSFLQMEREVLAGEWRYSRLTHKWRPPK
jgi:hypothetical protein